ncbi:MAG TPA: galactokinase [Clostridiaceae bacterium]|nr:galactokinase [Clostridiaceae bacterium]
MFKTSEWEQALEEGILDNTIRKLAVIPSENPIPQNLKQRFLNVMQGFIDAFKDPNDPKTSDPEVAFFSAPGRTELIGNHTDHQQGQVLAAAVNMDVWAFAAPNNIGKLRYASYGWPSFEVEIQDWEPNEDEYGSTNALLKGVAACFVNKGYEALGVDIFSQSTVLPGSGLSSSASIEVLFAVVLNHFWAADKENAEALAKIGQIAENKYFGKPSGLMDQMASAVGQAVHIDFKNEQEPIIVPVALDLEKEGYALCIIDSGADHADLTDEYAAITQEMFAVAEKLGVKVLRSADQDKFFAEISSIRQALGDRAVLRAMHFFDENDRVAAAAKNIRDGNFLEFLRLINDSGESSWCYLQNISPTGEIKHQAMGVTIALAKHALAGTGAVRVHGGGFAGTVQAFVPIEKLIDFQKQIDSALSEGSCHIVQIRSVGGFALGQP